MRVQTKSVSCDLKMILQGFIVLFRPGKMLFHTSIILLPLKLVFAIKIILTGLISWEALHRCFEKFDEQESWKALNNTIELYRKATIETAHHLTYKYNERLDNYVSEFIKK
jgi:hypothetical protein